MVRAGADFSGLKKGMENAQKSVKNFKNNVNAHMAHVGKSMKDAQKHTHGFVSMYKDMVKMSLVMGAVAATFAPFAVMGDGVKDAMKFEAQMGTLSETLGSSMKDFVNWQNTVGASLGYSKMQSAELANTLSLNFKQIATSQKDLMEKTTKMMETAAIIANKRGMAMTEVSDRIRSAMNQEADGADELGVNVRVTAIEQSKAYQQMANGTPWADLSTNMQKAILYHHILQSVSANLGDTLQNNTAMKMAVFTATLGDVKLALGQAFLPILNVVLPVLSGFMRKIETALQYVAAFTRALFGGGSVIKQQKSQISATNDQAAAVSGLGDAIKQTGKDTKKAAKEAKGSVAAFDEINQLADSAGSSGDSGGGGDAGGGGGVGASLPLVEGGQTEGVFAKVSKKAQEFAEKVKKFFKPLGNVFKEVYKAVKEYLLEKFEYIAKFWRENSEQMGQAWKNFLKIMKPIVKFIVKLIWNDIKGAIDGIIDVVLGFLKIFTGVFTGDWKKVWEGCKDVFKGAIKAILNILDLMLIGKAFKAIKGFGSLAIDFFKKIGPNLNTLWTKGLSLIKSGTKSYFDNVWIYIKGKFTMMIAKFKEYSGQLWEALKSKFSSVYAWFKTNVTDKIVSVFVNVKNTVASKAADIWNAIKGKFKDVYTWFKTNLSDKLVTVLTNVKSLVATKANDIWSAIKGKFKDCYNWFKTNITDKLISILSNAKTSAATKAGDIWSAIKGKFRDVYNWFNTNVTGKIGSVLTNAKNTIANKAGDIWSSIKGKFHDVYDWFKRNVADKISGVLTTITWGVSDGFKGTVIGVINHAIDLINGMLSKLNSALQYIDGHLLPGNAIPNIPQIPKLAKGGITNGPTLALIGDNPGGQEVVSPLDKLEGLIASAVGTAVMSANRFNNSGPAGDIVIKVDGTTLARVMKPYLEKENKRSGKPVIVTT